MVRASRDGVIPDLLMRCRRAYAIAGSRPMVRDMDGVGTRGLLEAHGDFSVDRLHFGRKEFVIDDLSSDRVPKREFPGALAAFADELGFAGAREGIENLGARAFGHTRQQACVERPSDHRGAQ